jgi:hypothetical protein
LEYSKNSSIFAYTKKINKMGYKPSFKWTDELAMDFAKISIMAGFCSENTLNQFKAHHEQKKREDRIKRVVVGKRGMNEDGSRFYYDCRGVKWTLKREVLDNLTYYIAESEKNEGIKEKFLSDVYLMIDKKAESENITKNNFEEILK